MECFAQLGAGREFYDFTEWLEFHGGLRGASRRCGRAHDVRLVDTVECPSGTTTAAQAGTSVSIKVVNTGIGATTSSGVNLAITAPVVVPPPPPPVVAVTPGSASVETGKTQQFAAGVTGAANTAVVWSVNTIAGGNSSVGTIAAGGLYTAPVAVPSPAGVIVRATSVVNATASATASVAITPAPGGGVSQGTPNLAAGRFLEQAAFGPTPAELAHVKSVGIDAWLNEQFAMAETPIASPGGMNIGAVQAQHLHRLATAPDQLRQRMVTALGGIIVISANKNIYPEEIVPYLQILSKNAFGNYRTLLGDRAQPADGQISRPREQQQTHARQRGQRELRPRADDSSRLDSTRSTRMARANSSTRSSPTACPISRRR